MKLTQTFLLLSLLAFAALADDFVGRVMGRVNP
jgi:hypothetical protein